MVLHSKDAWKYILKIWWRNGSAAWEVVSSRSERSWNHVIANAWAGVSRFCCRHRSSSAREIKAEGDQRIDIAAEIYIGALHEGWDPGPERDPQPSIIVNRFVRSTVMVSSCYRLIERSTYHNSLATFLR